MFAAAVSRVVRGLETRHPITDAELVAAIAPASEDREAAFAELVRRYGGMVLGVCRRVLADSHAAEDAFQAVFLVLAKKAKTIRPPGAVGGWLYGVAVRTARKAKTAAARRRRREMATAEASRGSASRGCEPPVSNKLEQSELRAIIDAELAALPEPHRAAVVLCDLHGKTRAEAAAELDRPEGTVAAWLARGRKALAARLARRGIVLPAAGLASVATPAVVSAELARAAASAVLGRGLSPAVLALAESVMRSLSSSVTKLAAVTLAAGALLAAVASAMAWHSNPEAKPDAPPAASTAPVPPERQPDPTMFGDHKGYVYSVSYSPDGKRYLSVGNGTAIVWDAETRKKLFTFDAEFAAFFGDGKNLFALVKDEFRTVDAKTGKTLDSKKRNQPKPVRGGRCAAFARDATMWVEFDGVRHHLHTENTNDLYDLADQYDSGDITGDAEVVYGHGGAFSPNGALFAGLHKSLKEGKSGQGVLSVWASGTGVRVGTISRDFNHPIYSFAWSPDGTELAVGYGDGVRVYDAKTLKESRVLDKPGRWGDPLPWTTALAWSADGKTIAAAVTAEERVHKVLDDDRVMVKVSAIKVAVRLLDATNGKELRRIEGFPDNLPVVSLAFRQDGKQLVCGAGFFPGDGPASNYPQPAKDAPCLRVIPLNAPAAKPANPWRESKVLELTGWLAGSVAYSGDGKVLFIGGTSGHVRAYDTATMKQLWDYEGKEHFAALSIAPDGKTLAITTKDGVQFLDAATGKAGDKLEEKDTEPLAVGFFPDTLLIPSNDFPPLTSRKVIFGNARGYVVKTWLDWPKVSTINLSTVAAGKKPADDYAVPLAVAPDGKRVVVTGPIDRDTGKNVLWAWSAGSGEANKRLEGHKATVVSAAWSKDGKLILTGDADGVVITWDAATFKEKSRLSLGARVAAVAISPDGHHSAVAVARLIPAPGQGAYAEELFVWGTATPPEKPEPISRHEAGAPFTGVASLAFAPDSKSLASGFANFDHLTKLGELVGKVRVFALEVDKPKPDPKPEPAARKWNDSAVLTDHGTMVTGVAVAPDGKSFAAATEGNVTCWDSATRKVLWTYKPTDSASFALAYSPDGKHLCVATKIDVVRLDANTGKNDPWTDDNAIQFGKVHALAYHPTENRLAASDGYWVRGRRLDAKGEEVTYGVRPENKATLPAGVAWSKDGKRLAFLHHRKVDGKWPVGLKGGPTTALVGHEAQVTALAWSKDGKVIATGDEKGTVILWDSDTGKELWRKAFKGRDDTLGRINALAISPADNTVAVAVNLGSGKGADRVVLLATKDGEDVDHLMRAWRYAVTSVAWDKDGKYLVTGCGSDGRNIPEDKTHVGEVVIWERKP